MSGQQNKDHHGREELGFDPTDPHGQHEGHEHGHFILPPKMLIGVLVALLLLTGLTVGAAEAEVWIANTFNLDLPQMVNVVVAMTIASIKSVLVLLFFMQLKYDNPLNSVIFISCILLVALFLGISMLDLGTRDRVYAIQAGEIVEGGTGNISRGRGDRRETIDRPIVEYARQRLIADIGEEAFWEKVREQRPEEVPPSSANKSRPREGLTPGLFENIESPGEN